MQIPVVTPLDTSLKKELQKKIDEKTKPPGSLGILEELALQIALIQKSLTPRIESPAMVVFAADHGITEEKVSAFPSEVTAQMVLNFLGGGAAINLFSRESGMDLFVVDAGVNFDFASREGMLHKKVRKGTRNFFKESAMTPEELEQCLTEGASIVEEIHSRGCNTIGFGEMGIGNTSSAAVLLSLLGNISLERCVGAGTGLDDDGIKHKLQVLSQAVAHHAIDRNDPYQVLATFGGLEIAMMTGAMLAAASRKMVILVDGFIATAAALAAEKMAPLFREYAVFCHRSREKGHAEALQIMNASPLLELNMRLGEGTGAALALPILRSSVAFLNEMASFAEAGVDEGKT